MAITIEHDPNAAPPLSRAEREALEKRGIYEHIARTNQGMGEIPTPQESSPKPRTRTAPQRPPTRDLEGLFFKLAAKLSKREATLLLCALGRLTVEEVAAEFSGE